MHIQAIRTALLAVFGRYLRGAASDDERWEGLQIANFLAQAEAPDEQALRKGMAALIQDADFWHREGLISEGAHAAFALLQQESARLQPTPCAMGEKSSSALSGTCACIHSRLLGKAGKPHTAHRSHERSS